MPEIVRILNNEKSKPPALDEKPKYLTINIHGNIVLLKIFFFQIQIYAIWKQSFLLTHQTLKQFGILGHLCK